MTMRIATWNIHKGVSGIGPAKRLEIHHLALGVESLNADIICLQEVRKFNAREAKRFAHARWPDAPQADVLAPEGYQAIYETNARTRFGEHGNALLSRWPVEGHAHLDMSDHRFEQRGLLHVRVNVRGSLVHVIVVHLGLLGGGRLRQVAQLAQYVSSQVPEDAHLVVAGDWNDWAERLHEPLRRMGLRTLEGVRLPTFPAQLPVLHLDRVYARGLRCTHAEVPRGTAWAKMSDHLPLVMHLEEMEGA
jgi:endonuclease/exonuclease/phosphatase family metal-dependent hydrolase